MGTSGARDADVGARAARLVADGLGGQADQPIQTSAQRISAGQRGKSSASRTAAPNESGV